MSLCSIHVASTFASLRATRSAYYANQRFADVFASLEARAPPRSPAASPPSPASPPVETRVVAQVTLDLPDLAEPAHGPPHLDPRHAAGRASTICFCAAAAGSTPGRPDEVLASEAFVAANRLDARRPRRRRHQRPPAPPDDRRRGALARVRLQHPARRARSRRPALRHVLDGAARARERLRHGGRVQRRGAGAVARAPSADDVIARLDRLLEPYGGLGAIPRALQLSHWTLENELAQLQSFGFLLPLDLPAASPPSS